MIGVLGISHKTATLDIRGLFSISQQDIISLSEDIIQHSSISEVVIISTCNRTEVFYAQVGNNSIESKRTILQKLHEYNNLKQNYSHMFYHHTDTNAARHLFEVTSGVDSMIIGEDQIVNQVKEAYLFCTEAALTDAVLMRLFQKSFECSKRVRTETQIQQGATSVSYVAVDWCARKVGNLDTKNVLFVGTGETGRLALINMKKRGVTNITVTNRTHEKALKVAQKQNTLVLPFEDFIDNLYKADIIFVATGAKDFLIHSKDVENALLKRNGQQQLYIDLSVPSNIDPEVNKLDNIDLVGVDDLQKILDDNKEMRELSVDKARVIINELISEYMTWLDSRTLRPVINTITANLQQLTERELSEYRKNLDPIGAEQIDKYTQLLTQKYIRTFIRNLKTVTNNGNSITSLDDINDLFRLDQ
ncbi:glutamyl-tRNA reductase [Puteibacter caeruleilacunae]|nr:glutamyl-tRNA reductase [Puteibacter caeruleilacunae]